MAALPKELTITVKQQAISVVEGRPGDLFVMKMAEKVPLREIKRVGDQVGEALREQFPGSRLLVLGCEVDGVASVSEENILKAIRGDK